MLRLLVIAVPLAFTACCGSYLKGFSVFESDKAVQQRLNQLTPAGTSFDEVKSRLSKRAKIVSEYRDSEVLAPKNALILRTPISFESFSIAVSETRFGVWRFDERNKLKEISIVRMNDGL